MKDGVNNQSTENLPCSSDSFFWVNVQMKQMHPAKYNLCAISCMTVLFSL